MQTAPEVTAEATQSSGPHPSRVQYALDALFAKLALLEPQPKKEEQKAGA